MNGVGTANTTNIAPPNGLAQITATFGDIQKYIRSDGTLDPIWQIDFLSSVALPFPLRLSFDHSQTITHFTCHRLLIEVFANVFEQIAGNGLQTKITSFGGCFAFRPQRTGMRLSTHSWGIAIDLNPETNQQGTIGDMDAGVIKLFRSAGFEWGGNWDGTRRDAMHFQFCSGY